MKCPMDLKQRKTFLEFGLSVLVLAVSTVPAAAQVKPDVTKPGLEPGVSTAPKPGDGNVGVAVDPNKYVLGPEDIIFIRVWREPDFTGPVAIRPDGKISMPLINEVQAAGLTPMQLSGQLKDALSKYINSPDVTVLVNDVRSKKFFIDGQIKKPGPFPLVTPTTVFEALSLGGGFQDFSNPKKIKILRGDKVFKFNYKTYVSGKDRQQNIYLENGDHIIVP